jgi:hypothetical protein
MALGNLGTDLRLVRRFDEATGILRQAVENFRADGDRRNEAMALTSLGNALRDTRYARNGGGH